MSYGCEAWLPIGFYDHGKSTHPSKSDNNELNIVFVDGLALYFVEGHL